MIPTWKSRLTPWRRDVAIIHRVCLRVTNRQSSGNSVGSLRKRRERERKGERECTRRGDEIEGDCGEERCMMIMVGRIGGKDKCEKDRWKEREEERETAGQGEGDKARGGLLPHTSRFVSPERKFSTNALCTLGLRRIGRAIPTTVPVYRRVGCVADYVRKGVARPFISRK